MYKDYDFLSADGQIVAIVTTQDPQSYFLSLTQDRPEIVTYREHIDTTETLEQLKELKVSEINQCATAYLTGGFSSGEYRYDSALIDQANLQTATIGAMATLSGVPGAPEMIPYRCFAPDGTKGMVLHTPAQMLAVFAAWGEHLATATTIGDTLKRQLQSAATPEEVEAIQWPEVT